MTEPAYLSETRTAYDTVAADYAELLRDSLTEMPWDRALLATFAELVHRAGGGRVGDLGCGPGRLTGHLASLGLDVFGVDLSPGMVAVARKAHPGLRFDHGSITDLDLADASLGGAVAWYSIIHTPPELLPVVFAEFHRVLAPGGHLLLAFQVGDDQRVRLEQGYGHEVSYDVYRLSPERIEEKLGKEGFVVDARVVREPEGRETTRQAYLVARRPAADQPTTDAHRSS